MVETSGQKLIQIRVIGIYVIIILVLLRFVIFPLRATIQDRKVVLDEQQEAYSLKYRLFERQRENQGEKTIVEKDAILAHLYDKGISNSFIYSEVLELVTKYAEKKGLTVMTFEMLEPIAGKNITEVPILIRLKGQPGLFIGVLEIIKESDKVLNIRSMEINKIGQDQFLSLTISAFRLEV